MSPNPMLAEVARSALDKMLRGWQKNPFIFQTVQDVRAEIYSRLTNAYRVLGHGTIRAQRQEHEHLGVAQDWNRVACEPPIDYVPDCPACSPDIVVWEEGMGEDGGFRIAWACEVRYEGKMEGTLSEKDLWEHMEQKVEWDLNVLENLFEREEVGMGCALLVVRGRTDHDDGIFWQSPKEGSKVLRCVAALPKPS
jgi:hypothetical protein